MIMIKKVVQYFRKRNDMRLRKWCMKLVVCRPQIGGNIEDVANEVYEWIKGTPNKLGGNIMEIKKGQKFLCIKTVIMDDGDGEIAYLEGDIFISENDNCITDIKGNKYHEWNNFGIDRWNCFFKLID